MPGFILQRQQPFRVVEKAFAGSGQGHALACAHKQIGTDIGLQLLNARGDVGRRPAKPSGRVGDAQLARHRAEDPERFRVHRILK